MDTEDSLFGMQSQCDDEYSICSQSISDTKLQLEGESMDDSQEFCLDFDSYSDMRVNHNFDNDSEPVVEEGTLI